MHICFVVPGFDISGGLAVVYGYANLLARAGVAVDIVAPRETAYDGWFGPVAARLIAGPEAAVTRLLESQCYDAAVATYWPTVFALRSGRIRAHRHLYLVQGLEEEFFEPGDPCRPAVVDTLTGPETKIAVSRYLGGALRDRYGIDATVIVNGIDLSVFRPVPPFMSRGRRARFLVEGAPDNPKKRVRDALELIGEAGDFETWLVTGTLHEPPFLPVDLLLKAVPRAGMAQVYSACDMLLKLSHTEGFGFAPLEMMACGGIPIVEDYGGQRDYIRHGENGFVLRTPTGESLRTIVDLLADDATCRTIQAGARDTARQFAWSDQGERFLAAVLDTAPDDARPRSYVYAVDGDRGLAGDVHVDVQAPGQAPARPGALPQVGLRIAGWVGLRGQGDISRFRLRAGATVLYEGQPGLARPDVGGHLQCSGDFGFDVWVVVDRDAARALTFDCDEDGFQYHVDSMETFDLFAVPAGAIAAHYACADAAEFVLATPCSHAFAFPVRAGTGVDFGPADVRCVRDLGRGLVLGVRGCGPDGGAGLDRLSARYTA
jgi:glycosyltransferase involved in cell wall biosynthesis